MVDFLFKTDSKLNKRKIVFFILTLFCMAVIFYFSSRTANVSTEDSHRVGKFIGYVMEYDFQNWTEDAQEIYAARLDEPIRKVAHFTEFFLLGIALTGFLYDAKRSKKQKVLIPLIVGVLYAVSDELHQLIVGAGRACQVTDVLIDSGGVFMGIMLACLNIYIVRKAFAN